MCFTAQSCKVSIRITVAEADLRELLLILYSYSCVQYVIEIVHSSYHSGSGTAEGDQQLTAGNVDIEARCDAGAIPALVEELANVFGSTKAFQVIVQPHEHP